MESLPFQLGNANLQITFSAGIAVYQGEAIHQILMRVDKGLYAAKKAGRNQVVWVEKEEE